MRTRLVVLAVMTLSGCAGWGLIQPEDASTAAVRSALAAQRIEPAGRQEAPSPDGMDGRAAQGAYKQFEKSFGEQGAAGRKGDK